MGIGGFLPECFTQGCFGYDLLVQILATLGALVVAVVIYSIGRRHQLEDAKKEEKARLEASTEEARERWRVFERQLSSQRRLWEHDRRTVELERRHEVATRRLNVALALQVELSVLEHRLAGVIPPQPVTSIGLDRLSPEYFLLPMDTVIAIATASVGVSGISSQGPFHPDLVEAAVIAVTAASEELTIQLPTIRQELAAISNEIERLRASEQFVV